MYAKFNGADDRWMFSFDQVDETWREYPDADHAALFTRLDAALPQFMVIGTGKDGLPEVQLPPAPSISELEVSARIWRNSVLVQTDGAVARHRDQVEAGSVTTLTGEQYRLLQVYRQALRDWPDSVGNTFPLEAGRPVPPGFLAVLLAAI
ncbi:phage tail protein [Pseudomonas gingeri]|uniref:Phage tail protein n=1 Tax=Pseudomonas gingeri TaxID=117681 RepID=A0A7Y7X7F8_9PSED|nr:phage tail protein [Pseudomonas gingeri]NWB94634.1 phage tail protein [Pseudomonas gingeri]